MSDQAPAGRGRSLRVVASALMVGLAVVTAVLTWQRLGDDGSGQGAAAGPSDPAEPGGGVGAPTEPPVTVSPPTPPTPTRPTPSPTSAPTPSAPAPAPTGQPVDLGDLVEQVSAVRGLAVLAPIEVGRLDEPQMEEVLRTLAFADVEPGELERDAQLLVSLRLLEPRDDLRGLLESLYQEAVVGLYSPEHERLYVLSDDAELSAYGRFTAAHEITHALQDQHHDLEALQDLPVGEDDAQLALLALVEGDAVLTQQAWSRRHLSPEARTQLAAEAVTRGGGAADRFPRYLRRSLEMPYLEGTAFVAAVMAAGAASGGDDVRAGLYANPPTTTEQILHPERYLAGEGPVSVEVADELAAEGWTAVTTVTAGEFDVVEVLWPIGREPAATAAAGWGGGRARLWERPGESATSVALEFDTRQDASEACAAFADWYGTVAAGTEVQEGVFAGDRDFMALACGGTSVRMGLGPDASTAVGARGQLTR